MITADLITFINIVMLALLVITALGVFISDNLLVSTILLSIFSFLMAGQYLVLGAPDVAITEAAVGAGVSTVLLLLGISIFGHKEKKYKDNLLLPVVIVGLTGVAIIYATIYMPSFGSKSAPSQMHLAPYYLNQSYEEIGIPNVVTSILASYRGFDTFGEVTVVFTAALCVLMLIGNFRKRGDN